MKLAELRARRCPFHDCPSASSGLRPRVVRHATFNTRRGSRLRLLRKHCQRSFVATHATAYCRLRRPRSGFVAVVALLPEGVSQAAIARARGLSPSTVSRWISRAAEHSRAFEEARRRICDGLDRIGAHDATVHSLRHTFATRLLRATGDLFLVKRALLQRSIASTAVYLSVSDERLRDALEAVR
jgi:integrase